MLAEAIFSSPRMSTLVLVLRSMARTHTCIPEASAMRLKSSVQRLASASSIFGAGSALSPFFPSDLDSEDPSALVEAPASLEAFVSEFAAPEPVTPEPVASEPVASVALVSADSADEAADSWPLFPQPFNTTAQTKAHTSASSVRYDRANRKLKRDIRIRTPFAAKCYDNCTPNHIPLAPACAMQGVRTGSRPLTPIAVTFCSQAVAHNNAISQKRYY